MFEILTLFRKTTSKIHTLFRTTPLLLALFRTMEKLHTILFFKPVIGNCKSREQIHVIVIGVETNFILFIIRTDSHKIIYPVLIGQTPRNSMYPDPA